MEECIHGMNPEWCAQCQRAIEGYPSSGSRQGKRRIDPAMRDLIGHGLLPVGARLHALYKGHRFEAVVQADGVLASEGRLHDSPSGAASSITGTAVNGWTWWSYGAATLADLRSRLD
ncbi:DUF2924 domain-containing protein [Nocardioides abyssi]|uniref:restriction system modified-DNA reader domain-containing protein n=1 Tax=Nocardioides abyssi TaxID=3058370 RepID=UPI0034DFC46C